MTGAESKTKQNHYLDTNSSSFIHFLVCVTCGHREIPTRRLPHQGYSIPIPTEVLDVPFNPSHSRQAVLQPTRTQIHITCVSRKAPIQDRKRNKKERPERHFESK